MAFPWAAVASIAGAGLDLLGTKESANASRQNTAAMIRWEKQRATNAHQWEVQDLENAGLNPVLSAGGSGATTSGISPQMPDTSGYSAAGDKIASAVKSMYEVENIKKQNDLLDDQGENVRADTEKKKAETEESGSRKKLNEKQQIFINKKCEEIASNITRNKVLNQKDKIDMLRIGKDIKYIESKTELTYKEAELKHEEKELKKEEQLLTIIKQKQGLEAWKGQQIQNKINRVHEKMRYIDKYFEEMQKISGMLNDVIPG